MKKWLLFAAAIFIINAATAQAEKNYTETMDSLFYNMSKTSVTTGILYDRVFPFAALHFFNDGVADTSSYRHFTQGYDELYRAAYNNSGMTTPGTVESNAAQNRSSGIVPLGLINYNFNYIDTLAIDNNLLSASGLLIYDVPGRPQHPFAAKQLTMLAALQDEVYTTGTVSFKLPNNLVISNTGLTVSSLQVDFNNGSGLQSVTVNSAINISYSSYGIKYLKFIITYSNSTQVTTYAAINVLEEEPPVAASGCNGFGSPLQLPIEATNTYQGAEETNGFKGKGLATILYHTTDCDRKIKKPIIIVDGFDPGSDRNYKGLWDRLDYGTGNPAPNFGKEMVEKGYDVIILDFPAYIPSGGTDSIDGGSDYIQRNAFTLIKLIQQINDSISGTGEELVVNGPSMGGLVSRYALAYMEQNNMPHNTRLWVSFDSPQLGANIPIGDQWLLHYLGVTLGLGMAKEKLYDQLSSPAARQILLHHFTTTSEPIAANSLRSSFVSELNSLGFPSQLRRISLVNGSGNGGFQGTAGNNIIDLEIKPKLTTRLFFNILGTRSILIRLISYILGAAPNYLRTKVFNTPGYNGYGKVFEGAAFSGLLLNRNRYAYSPTNSSGLDNVPGGNTNTQEVITDGVAEGLAKDDIMKLLLKVDINTLVPKHSFISTKSSLAITSGSNYGDNFSTRNLVSTSETPFHSYFAPSANETHVYLTPCSVDWITKEIGSVPQTPIRAANGTFNGFTLSPIYGEDCNAVQLIANNVNVNATVTWTTNNGLLINGNASPYTAVGNTVTISSPNGTEGSVTARVNECTASAPFNFCPCVEWSGSPQINWSWSSPLPNEPLCASVSPAHPNAVSYKWFINGNLVFEGSSNYMCTYTYPCVDDKDLTVIAVTNCGATAPVNGGPYSPLCYGARMASNITVFPNPASANATIKLTEPVTAQQNEKVKIVNLTQIITVQVYDKTGSLRKSLKFSKESKQVSFTVADLPTDVYYLHVSDGINNARVPLLIKR